MDLINGFIHINRTILFLRERNHSSGDSSFFVYPVYWTSNTENTFQGGDAFGLFLFNKKN